MGASEGDVNAPIKASSKSRRLISHILITLQNLDISKAQQVVRSQKLSATPEGSGRRGARTKLTMMAVARQGMMAAAIMTGWNENRSLMRPMR